MNKPDAPRPNQGKSLVVKLGMFKKKSLLGSDVNSGSSRNSSAVTSDSEGMLYSLADADVSSMSTSDSDSDNERAKKTGEFVSVAYVHLNLFCCVFYHGYCFCLLQIIP